MPGKVLCAYGYALLRCIEE